MEEICTATNEWLEVTIAGGKFGCSCVQDGKQLVFTTYPLYERANLEPDEWGSVLLE